MFFVLAPFGPLRNRWNFEWYKCWQIRKVKYFPCRLVNWTIKFIIESSSVASRRNDKIKWHEKVFISKLRRRNGKVYKKKTESQPKRKSANPSKKNIRKKLKCCCDRATPIKCAHSESKMCPKWTEELQRRKKKRSRKTIAKLLSMASRHGVAVYAPQTNRAKEKIGKNASKRFSISHFPRTSHSNKVFPDILVFACLLVPVPIRTEWKWLLLLLRFYSNFLFGQFSLALHKKPLKTTEFSGKEIFAPLLFECIWWLKFFGVVSSPSFFPLAPHLSLSNLANCAAQKALAHWTGTRTGLKAF